MKFHFIIYLLISSLGSIFSQTTVLDFENYFNSENKRVRAIEAFHTGIFNQTLFLLEDNLNKNIYLLDNEFNEVADGLKISKEVRKFPNRLSFSEIEKSSFSFLMANDNFNKWGLLNLNFANRAIVTREIPLKLKKAMYLSSFSTHQKHWVISLVRNSSTFRIQSVDATGAVESEEYDFSKTDFSGGLRSISNIYQLVDAKSENFTIDFIEENTPLSLLSTNEKMKIYRDKEELIVTIDNSRDYTYIIKINIINRTSEVITIEKEKFAKRSSYEDSNTFVYKDKLFALKTTFDVLNLRVTDIKTQEVLKTITVQGDEDIWFRNTSMTKKRLGSTSTSQIKKAKGFLRKVANSEPALSVHEQDNNLVLTIGASKHIEGTDDALLVGAIFAGAGGYIAVRLFTNPVSKNYLDYASTKTTRFQTVLTQDLNHVKHKLVEKNAFDLIKSYDKSHSIREAKTVFKINEGYYFSYIDKSTKRLKCIKF